MNNKTIIIYILVTLFLGIGIGFLIGYIHGRQVQSMKDFIDTIPLYMKLFK
jgi:NhaP-type Na+/H+ or K+/H+ antiporter